MNRSISGLIAVVVAVALATPGVAFAAPGRIKAPRADGSAPARWEVEKPKLPLHADIAPPSAGGDGNGLNGVHFTYFDDGDMVVVLGTLAGHAGLFDRPYYSSGLSSWAVISANTSPRSAVQREQCLKYRGYDEAFALWVPSYAAYGIRARNYARSKLGQPYDILSSKADQTRWYCSKLCWSSWRYTAGVDLDADGGYWVWPVDLVNSGRTSLFGHWL
ncbi:MAG TPA: hypothetical protein VF902_02125 [Coriobacteriia bacterium]